MRRLRDFALLGLIFSGLCIAGSGVIAISYKARVDRFEHYNNSSIVLTPNQHSALTDDYMAEDLDQFVGHSFALLLLFITLAMTVSILYARWAAQRDILDALDDSNSGEEPTARLLNAESMTLIRKKNEVIRGLSKKSSLAEISAGIAHEIKSPLAAIQIAAQVTEQKSTDLDPKIHKLSKSIVSNCKRITQIIRGIENMSRNGESDPFELVDIRQLIEATVAICKAKIKTSKVTLKVEVEGDGQIHCRSAQLSQVIVNLINNAVDALETLDEKWVHLRAEESDGGWLIKITDSGKGIPEKIASEIMKSYYTTKAPGKGTGIGLSISKKIVEKIHGGQFYLDRNSPNTTFVVKLPPRKVVPFQKSA